MARLADLGAQYLRKLCAEVLGLRQNSTVLNIADTSSRSGRETAARMVELIGEPTCPKVLSGQTAGNEFTRLTMDFMQEAFLKLDHVRPGSWFFAMNPSEDGGSRIEISASSSTQAQSSAQATSPTRTRTTAEYSTLWVCLPQAQIPPDCFVDTVATECDTLITSSARYGASSKSSSVWSFSSVDARAQMTPTSATS